MSIQHHDIAAIRQDYVLGSLSETEVDNNPLSQFEKWFQAARHSEVMEPNAMVLSTVDAQNKPSSRIVLLKDIDRQGLVFFTNYESKKGKDMLVNSAVSILFFWPELQRQVRIEGEVEKVDHSDSDEYFQSRPKGSRIGAIASPQSQAIPDRDFLEKRVAEVEQAFHDIDFIPRPQHWGGYRVKPTKIEFWQGRASRLHDRIVYTKQTDDSWKINRLAP